MQFKVNMMFNSNAKKLISALFLTFLIVTSIGMFTFPKVNAQTSEATVVSFSWYVAPADSNMAYNPGDLIVVGEVQNIGTNTIQSMGVLGTVFDTNSTLLAQTSIPVFGYFLLPGQKAPFYMEFTPDTTQTPDQSDSTWIPYIGNITVVPVAIVDYNQTGYAGLTVLTSSLQASTSSGSYTVTGTLKNSGDQIVAEPVIVTTFYNASGTVIGVDYTDPLADTLAPNATVSFSATPIDDTTQMTNAITNYTVLPQYSPYTPTPTPTSTPINQTPTPTPNQTTPTPTTTPNTAQNNISNTTLFEIIGAIVVVVVVAVLAATLMLRRRQKTENFESPAPFSDNDLPPPPPPA